MKLPLPVVACVVGLWGCARGSSMEPPIDAAPDDRVDAPASDLDAAEELPDASVRPDAPPAADAPLLLTEIVLTPSTGEYVEITNPNAVPYSLASYYLADSGNYFRVPTGATVESTDFIVKFPAGAQIAAKATITVALDTAANFETVYGVAPTYSIASGAGTMEAVAVNGVASLTNAGEVVILFQWDGQADLVRDVDIMLAGAPTVANSLLDKSGIAQDGPDGGNTTSPYAVDARTIAAQPSTPAAGKSTKRIALEAGNEVQSGTGNGITGDDETSENTAVTWDTTFVAPTPGTLPAGLVP